MKKLFFKNILSSAGQLFLIGLLSFNVACKDEPARLTGDVLPDGEMINGLNYDGYEVGTFNTQRDRVRTSDATYGVLGEFHDPIFGVSKAAFLSDFSVGSEVKFVVDIVELTAENDTIIHEDYVFNQFNNNVDTIADVWSVDSVVVNLQYQFNNWYGDMTTGQNVNIYELYSGLGSVSQEYYSDYPVDGTYNPVAIAQKIVFPNNEVPDSLKSTNWDDLYQHPDSLWNAPQYLWDNVKVQADKDSSWLSSDFNGNTTQTKTWSFRVNDEVEKRIFDANEISLKSSANFQSLFPGIYVSLDDVSIGTGNGWLAKINLLSSSSSVSTNMGIHLKREYKYINSEKEVRDTSATFVYAFPINLENVRFNTYEHGVSSEIDMADENQERLYVQGMAGSYMKMTMPEEIINWVDSIGDPAEVAPLSTQLDYHMVANVEFFMEVDTVLSEMDHYPIPDKLSIKWENEKGEIVDPIYTIIQNGNSVSVPVFGTNADSQGSRAGIGERVLRYSDEGRPEYLYRFIMRADYFNYIMRHQDGGSLDEKVFYIGPDNGTADFQRVVLFGGVDEEKPLKMNIKYYQYRPR